VVSKVSTTIHAANQSRPAKVSLTTLVFQSLTHTKHLGYDKKTQIYSHEYNLTDSDFTCTVVWNSDWVGSGNAGAVIQEYSKRNLNVAANLLLYFRWYEKLTGLQIAKQIEWAEQYQLLFTPQIKADIEKYLSLL
jgi:hypothetical protein